MRTLAYWFKARSGKTYRAKSSTGSVTFRPALAAQVRAAIRHHGGKIVRRIRTITRPAPDAWRLKIIPQAGVDLEHVDHELLNRIAAVATDLGVIITATSGYRSPQHQAELYQAYLAGKGPLAAKPGTSNHERGLAVDCYIGSDPICGGPLGEKARASMRRHKLVLGAAGELWHVEKVETGSGWRA